MLHKRGKLLHILKENVFFLWEELLIKQGCHENAYKTISLLEKALSFYIYSSGLCNIDSKKRP